MPKRVDDTRVPRAPGLDRRMKLTDAQRAEIRENADGLSQRGLATKYGVSRRRIVFILFPERLEQNRQLRKARGSSYDPEKHRENVRRHRAYKKKLLEKGIFE